MYTDCKYEQCEGDVSYCKIAYELSAIKSVTSKEACEHCSKIPNSRTHNSVTASLALQAVRTHKPEMVKEYIYQIKHLLTTEEPDQKVVGEGPGTELTKLLSWFAKDTPGCKCKDHANLMNVWGVDGCRNNMETILQWLETAAKDRGIPFIKPLAKSLVNLAIKRAESCTPKDAS
jgi:hypothetical protein